MFTRRRLLFATLLIGLFSEGYSYPIRRLRVAAAASLSQISGRMSQEYETLAGIEVAVTLGSSGLLVAQIRQGAPFDLFLSADRRYPEALEGMSLVVPGSETVYALGRLVLWRRTEGVKEVGIEELSGLKSAQIRRIAIPNPDLAPYGLAARQSLKRSGLWAEVRKKLVLGENAAQTAHFVRSGAADVGLISLSLAVAPSMQRAGRYWLVAEGDYDPVEHGAVILVGAEKRGLLQEARAFLRWLVSPAGRRLLTEAGFAAASGDGLNR